MKPVELCTGFIFCTFPGILIAQYMHLRHTFPGILIAKHGHSKHTFHGILIAKDIDLRHLFHFIIMFSADSCKYRLRAFGFSLKGKST